MIAVTFPNIRMQSEDTNCRHKFAALLKHQYISIVPHDVIFPKTYSSQITYLCLTWSLLTASTSAVIKTYSLCSMEMNASHLRSILLSPNLSIYGNALLFMAVTS